MAEVENGRLDRVRGLSDPVQDRALDALQPSERFSGYEPESEKRGASRSLFEVRASTGLWLVESSRQGASRERLVE